MYRLVENDGQINTVLNIETNSFIPFDIGNVDYQQYLAWLAEGNTPLPPDNGP